MSKLYSFKCNIYPEVLWIAIGSCKEESKLHLRDEFPNEIADFGSVYWADCEEDVGTYINFFGLKSVNIEGVTHASIHAAMLIFRHCGITPDNNNQEPLCYLAEWVAKCCKEVLNEEYCKIQKSTQGADSTN